MGVPKMKKARQSSSFICQEICYNSPMAEPKTKATKESVNDFLNKVEPEEKRQDSFALLEMFEKTTGENRLARARILLIRKLRDAKDRQYCLYEPA